MSMPPDQHETASTDAERVVADAWHRVLDLVDRLIEQPIDAATYKELRAYLDDAADEALAAYEQVTSDGVAALLDRVDQLSDVPPTLAVLDGGEGRGKAAS
jgi:GrpB-like predicted nucleotidyltransferase (UPF0157 family)